MLGTSDRRACSRRVGAGAASGAVSADGRVALIRVQYPVLEELRAADLENLKALVAPCAAGRRCGSRWAATCSSRSRRPEPELGELIGLVAAVVILLLAFGSVIAMGLPIGIALFGLALGISSMSLVTYLVDIPSWAPVLGSMVGLGVGIDYALFLITRHREYLARGWRSRSRSAVPSRPPARSVVFAGGTVVIAILGLAVAGVPFMTAGGIAIAAIVLIMVLASVTLLPAFLGLAGHRINGLGAPPPARPPADGGALAALGRARVAARRGAMPSASRSLLLALTAPVLALRLGIPGRGRAARRREPSAGPTTWSPQGFGPGSNGPLVIAVDISRDPSVVEPLRDAVARRPGHRVGRAGEWTPQPASRRWSRSPTTGPQDEATRDTVERLRDDGVPARARRAARRSAHVGGQTASFADVGDRVNDRLPLFIAAVILLSFLLLMRGLPVGRRAAQGRAAEPAEHRRVVRRAGDGLPVGMGRRPHRARVDGADHLVHPDVHVRHPLRPLDGLRGVPALAGARGVPRTGDNDGAVVDGIAGTARVITSAALIMISVFLGFVLGDDPATKMFGLGLATAIFIDATIVRMVLVPGRHDPARRRQLVAPGLARSAVADHRCGSRARRRAGRRRGGRGRRPAGGWQRGRVRPPGGEARGPKARHPVVRNGHR